jgi:hypothetical protein
MLDIKKSYLLNFHSFQFASRCSEALHIKQQKKRLGDYGV